MVRQFDGFRLRCRICLQVYDSDSINKKHNVCSECAGNPEIFREASFRQLLESITLKFSKWQFKGFEQRADDMVIK